MDNIIKSVVRQHHWAPDTIGALFIDREDVEGLIYWYDEALESEKEMEARIAQMKSQAK